MKSPLLGWIDDFLVGCSIKVRLVNESHLVEATNGVPQSSIISSIFLLVFINHICHDINAKFVFFADDLKLYLATKYKKWF